MQPHGHVSARGARGTPRSGAPKQKEKRGHAPHNDKKDVNVNK